MKYLKLFEEYKVDNITEQDIIDTIERNGKIKVSSVKDLPSHKKDEYIRPADIDGDSIIVDIDGHQYSTNLKFVTKMEYSELAESISFSTDGVISEDDIELIFYHDGYYTGGEFKGNAWFTANKSDAKHYATQNDDVITKAKLISKNPLYSGDVRHLNIKISDDIIKSIKNRSIEYAVKVDSNGIIQFIEVNNAVLIARDIGRDSVINLSDGEIDDVVVFSNNQIIKL